MRTHLRIPAGALVAAWTLSTGALQAQDLSDIAAATRELRQTLRDLDKRLSRLENLVNQQPSKRKKKQTKNQPVKEPAPAIQIDPAADLIAGQDAYRRAGIEENGQQYQTAIELYTKAIHLDPGNELAFLHRAISNLHIGRLDEALSDADRSVAIQPNNAPAYAFRGNVHAATKSYDKALADFEEASRRDPRNVDYLLSQAGVEEQTGDFKKADEIYENAAKIKPDAPEIYVKRAGALRQLNQGPLAVVQCGVAIRLKPTAADGYACRAESYVRSGLLPPAVSDLNQAVRLQPELPQLSNLLKVVGEMLTVNETLEKVTAAENSKAAEPAPTPVESCEAKVSVAPPVPKPMKVDPPKPLVVKELETAVPDPAESRRLMRESRRNIEQGSFPAAITNLDRAIQLDPSSAVAYNTRGYAYLRTRQLDSAIRDFSKAIDLDSGYANAYWNRAAARRSMGDTEGGREDLKKASQLGYPVSPPQVTR